MAGMLTDRVREERAQQGSRRLRVGSQRKAPGLQTSRQGTSNALRG